VFIINKKGRSKSKKRYQGKFILQQPIIKLVWVIASFCFIVICCK